MPESVIIIAATGARRDRASNAHRPTVDAACRLAQTGHNSATSWIKEVAAGDKQSAWRGAEDGSRLRLLITDAGLRGVVAEAEGALGAALSAAEALELSAPQGQRSAAASGLPCPTLRQAGMQALAAWDDATG